MTESFKEILKAPLLMTTTELKGDIEWRKMGVKPRDGFDTNSDDESMPNIVNCDKCNQDELSLFVTSYNDPTHQICIKCYNELRTIATDPKIVKNAKRKIHDMLIAYIETGKEKSKADQIEKYERNVAIWNMVNDSPCPFVRPEFES